MSKCGLPHRLALAVWVPDDQPGNGKAFRVAGRATVRGPLLVVAIEHDPIVDSFFEHLVAVARELFTILDAVISDRRRKPLDTRDSRCRGPGASGPRLKEG